MKLSRSCQYAVVSDARGPLRPVFVLAMVSTASFFFSGCAATQVALEHKDLSVQTKMSATIFLDVEARIEKTIFLDVRNTSSKDMQAEALLKTALSKKGYQVVPNAQDAFYLLQMNILYVGKDNPSALQESLGAGFGGPLAGGLAGAAIGGSGGSPTGMVNGMAAGGIIGGAAELVSGSLVKNVTFSMLTDLQISERTTEAVAQKVESNLQQGTGTQVTQSAESVRNRKKYQTRVLSTANKMNLKFEDAAPSLEEQLARSVAGIF